MENVAVTDRLTLGSGPTSIFDVDGSAIVIHQQADDQRTDPSGNSGDRVLCGQLVWQARRAVSCGRRGEGRVAWPPGRESRFGGPRDSGAPLVPGRPRLPMMPDSA